MTPSDHTYPFNLKVLFLKWRSVMYLMFYDLFKYPRGLNKWAKWYKSYALRIWTGKPAHAAQRPTLSRRCFRSCCTHLSPSNFIQKQANCLPARSAPSIPELQAQGAISHCRPPPTVWPAVFQVKWNPELIQVFGSRMPASIEKFIKASFLSDSGIW